MTAQLHRIISHPSRPEHRAGFCYHFALGERAVRGGPDLNGSYSQERPRRGTTERGRRRKNSMFAVLKTGGKQYRVQSGDMLRVEKLVADAG